MRSIEIFDTKTSLIAMGCLKPLNSFESRPKLSVGMPGDVSVLTCPVAAVDADCFNRKNADVTFGFGTIQLQAGLVQSIRLQVHDVQVYWLADKTDPEVWTAIGKWRQAKHALVHFAVRGQPRDNGHSIFLKPSLRPVPTVTSNSATRRCHLLSESGRVCASWSKAESFKSRQRPT